MKKLIAGAAAFLIASTGIAAAAGYIASGGGAAVVFDPFIWSADSADFYGHDLRDASAHTPVGLERSNAAVLFLLRSSSSGAGKISLGVVFDGQNDGTGGRAKVAVIGAVAGATLAVAEEGIEFDAATLTGDFRWWGCCTDGFVIDTINDAPLAAMVSLRETLGLDRFYVATPDGAGGARLIALGSGLIADVTVTALDLQQGVAAVPVPAAFPLLAGAFGLLGLIRLRARG
jgi:hypothetical protein